MTTIKEKVISQFALKEKDVVKSYNEATGEITILWSDRVWPSEYEFDPTTGELTMWEGDPVVNGRIS